MRWRKAGQTWTGISTRIKERFGIEVHRTTVQRCHDKWAFSDVHSLEIDEQVELDKKTQTYKAEASYWKKLYDQAIKASAKKELIVDTIQNMAPAIRAVSIPKARKSN